MAAVTVPGVLARARQEPSAWLPAAQLSAVLLYPFMEGGDVGRALFSVVGNPGRHAQRRPRGSSA